MTARTSTRPRILTSTRLYGAAVFAIGMAIPHAAIGVAGHWPGQLLSCHVLLIGLLLFAGRSTELAEAGRGTLREPAPGSDDAEFDQIVRMIRDHDSDSDHDSDR